MRHLTPEQAAQFKRFEEICKIKGLLDRPSDLDESDLPFGINDDPTLLRYLNARPNSIDEAFTLFREATCTRVQQKLNYCYEIVELKDFENSKKLYSHWSGRRDKHGRPLYIFDVGSLNLETMTSYDEVCAELASKPPYSDAKDLKIEKLRSLIFHDRLTRFILPLCSAIPDRCDPTIPITGVVHIADISSMSLRQFWRLRNFVLEFVSVLSVNYAETVYKILLIGAPSWFPTVWSFLKKFVDPVTLSKVVIVPAKEVLSTLTQTIDIQNIPQKYGGKLDFMHGMPLNLDPVIMSTLCWSSSAHNIPVGPIKWVQEDGETMAAIGVGNENGKARHFRFASLKIRDGCAVDESHVSAEAGKG